MLVIGLLSLFVCSALITLGLIKSCLHGRLLLLLWTCIRRIKGYGTVRMITTIISIDEPFKGLNDNFVIS